MHASEAVPDAIARTLEALLLTLLARGLGEVTHYPPFRAVETSFFGCIKACGDVDVVSGEKTSPWVVLDRRHSHFLGLSEPI